MNALLPLIQVLAPILLATAVTMLVLAVFTIMAARAVYRKVRNRASGRASQHSTAPRTPRAVITLGNRRDSQLDEFDALAAGQAMPPRQRIPFVVPDGTPRQSIGPLVVRPPLDDQPADVIANLVHEVFGDGRSR